MIAEDRQPKPIIEKWRMQIFLLHDLLLLSSCFIVSIFRLTFSFESTSVRHILMWKGGGGGEEIDYVESDSFSCWNLWEVNVIFIQPCCLLYFMAQYNEIYFLLLTISRALSKTSFGDGNFDWVYVLILLFHINC